MQSTQGISQSTTVFHRIHSNPWDINNGRRRSVKSCSEKHSIISLEKNHRDSSYVECLSVVDHAGPAVGLRVDQRGSITSNITSDAAVRLDQRLGVVWHLDGASPVTATTVNSHLSQHITFMKSFQLYSARLDSLLEGTHWETVGVMSL